MNIDSFAITFEITTEESAGHGEVESSGFHIEPEQGYSLRDAISWIGLHKGCGAPESADSSHLSVINPPRWFDYDAWENYSTGEHERISLHIPRSVSASSRMRIARALGYGTSWR